VFSLEGINVAMKPIQTSKRYRLVVKAIQDYIIKQELRPGNRLPTENGLVKALQVGRSSIREAVKSLEVLGVIETKAGEGMFVRSFNYDPILENLPYNMLFSRDDLYEILEIRISLELANLKSVLKNITEENRKKIKSNLDIMKQAVENKDKRDFVKADEKFHSLLFLPIGNKLLIKLLDIFWRLLKNAKDFNNLAEDDLESSYKRHLNIYNALIAGGYDRLYEVMKEHYKFSEGRIGDSYKKNKTRQ